MYQIHFFSVLSSNKEPSWRNWTARRTSNPKVRGSIPREGSLLLLCNHYIIFYLLHAKPSLQYHLFIPTISQNKCIRTPVKNRSIPIS